MQPPTATEGSPPESASPAAVAEPSADLGGVLDPRVIRRVASAVPLDVLVCDDDDLAEAAMPLFKEVHLLDPTASPSMVPDDGLPGGLVLHREPVTESLARLGAELSGLRVLYALSTEHDALGVGGLGPGSVLLSSGTPEETDPGWFAERSGRELFELDAGIIVGPGLLDEVLAPLVGPAQAARERVIADPDLALLRSEELVARLRSRNDRLEDQIARLRYELKGRRRTGPPSRLRRRLRVLRARLRPIIGVRLGLLWHHHPHELRIPDSYRAAAPPDPAPSVSIVVPSFNQGDFIGRTLESLLDQEYPELELIVEDGGSSDETAAVLEDYGDRLAHVFSGPDDGQAAAINAGLARSTGELMGWLNSDDILLPGSLAYVARYFAEHPEVDVIYGHRVLIDTEGAEIGRWLMPRHDDEILSWADYVPQETMIWRREIWERAGGSVNEDYRFALDWELLVRLRDAGATIVRLPRFLGAFRIHESQKSSAQVDTLGHGEMDRLRRRIHGRRIWPRETQAAIRPYLRRHSILDKLYRLGIIRH